MRTRFAAERGTMTGNEPSAPGSDDGPPGRPRSAGGPRLRPNVPTILVSGGRETKFIAVPGRAY